MTIPMGNGKLNLNPCTPEEERANIATQNTVNNYVTNQITELTEIIGDIEVSGTSDHKVSINATDNTALGYDYLHAKIQQADVADRGIGHVVVRSDPYGVDDNTEAFYCDLSTVNLYNDQPLMFLACIEGEIVWQEIATGGGGDPVDTYTVKDTSTSTPRYLHDALENTGTYVGGADINVFGVPYVASGADYKERLYLDVSAITDWDDTGTFVLSLVDNASKYLSIEDLGELLYLDATFIANIDVLINANTDKYRAIRGKATATTNGGSTTFTIDGIVALESGLDPRVDTGDAAETVTIANVPGERHENNEDVYADYNKLLTRWEARPNRLLRRIKSTTAIDARTDWPLINAGTGFAAYLNDDGTFSDAFPIKNHYFDEMPINHPGWDFFDGTNHWFINIGCTPGSSS